MHLKRVVLLFVLLLAFPAISLAVLPDNLTENFKNIAGVIIMPIGDEYLIDLDMSQGVAEGDIFSVVAPGEHVIHPVTGKILGSLDRVLGWLKVTRVKNGYSYAQQLGGDKALTKGTQIRRFENVPALFWDYSGDGEGTFAELRSALPHLEWMSYPEAQKLRTEQPAPLPDHSPRLFFIHRAGQLEARGAEFQLLNQFSVATAAATQAAPMITPTQYAAPLAVPAPKTNGIIPAVLKEAPSGGIVYNKVKNDGNIWTAAEWSDSPLGIEINDFDADGNLELAILFKDRIEVGRVIERKFQLASTLTLPGVDKALNISSTDLDGNGRPEIFISAMSGLKISSLVIAENNGVYQVSQGNLPWFLRAVQQPDGQRMVLGQALGEQAYTYSTEVVSLQYRNGSYVSAGRYAHPWDTSIFSLQPFVDQQGEKRFIEIAHNDRLRVLTADTDTLWESSKNYGGSVVFFPKDDSTSAADFATTSVYIKPRLALMEDGTTILAPLNEGWRLSESLQSIGPGRVVALQWDGSSMKELWHSQPQSGSLVDFQYADLDNDKQQELVKLVHFSRGGLLRKGRAGLRVFEFN